MASSGLDQTYSGQFREITETSVFYFEESIQMGLTSDTSDNHSHQTLWHLCAKLNHHLRSGKVIRTNTCDKPTMLYPPFSSGISLTCIFSQMFP